MKLSGIGKTDKGLLRENNEDAFFVDNQHGLYVVSDGMGGVEGGEVASQIIVDELPRLIKKALKKDMFIFSTEFVALLQESVCAVNDLVYREGILRGYKGMGATFVLALVEHDKVLVAHIGDSRCYRFHKGVLNALTKDHVCPDNSYELTRVLGVEGFLQASINCTQLEVDDVLILCSDGITHMLSDQSIQEVIHNSLFNDISTNLVQSSNTAGGEDNITVITVTREK